MLAAFLEDKGNLLRVFAVDTVKRGGAGRVLAQAMAETGEKVGDWGANEAAEGLIRMAVAQEGAERSADLFADGAMNAVGGEEALAAAAGARQVAVIWSGPASSRSLRAPKRSVRPRRWPPWLERWTKPRNNAGCYHVRCEDVAHRPDRFRDPSAQGEFSDLLGHLTMLDNAVRFQADCQT